MPLAEVQEALTMLHKHSPEMRKRIMHTIRITLGRNWPKVKKGTASPRDMILTRQDISIWFANEVLRAGIMAAEYDKLAERAENRPQKVKGGLRES